MSELIKLRGHHIPHLNEYIFWREINARWDPFQRERFCGYGEMMIENAQKLFQEIYDNPKQKIMIINNKLDDICLGGCPKKTSDCTKKVDEDALYARDLGFKVGKIYSSKDFINYVRRTQRLGKRIP